MLGPFVLLWIDADDRVMVFLALSFILLSFAVLAEIYRDYSRAFSAEHFNEYKYFVIEGEGLARMIEIAERRLFDERRGPAQFRLP